MRRGALIDYLLRLRCLFFPLIFDPSPLEIKPFSVLDNLRNGTSSKPIQPIINFVFLLI